MNIRSLEKIGNNALHASRILSSLDEKIKNKVLNDYIKILKKEIKYILLANKKDLSSKSIKNLKKNYLDRMTLNEKKIYNIILSIQDVIKIKDPTNKIIERWKRPNGMILEKVSIPFGVVAVIYESRPNVTADVSTLCFKSGNAVILRGGSETTHSNKILSDLFRKALKKNKIDSNVVQFIQDKNRKVVDLLLSKMEKYINVIIPRGGKNLVKKVKEKSNVPTIGHLEGVCHTYVDENADLGMAKKVTLNAKMRNTSICGSTETLLIHKKNIKSHLHPILNLLSIAGCKIKGDKIVVKNFKRAELATVKDWGKEFLDSIIAVKIVNNIQEAINHINRYGTHHTDAIITDNKKNAEFFLKKVDSAIVLHNASTQFADGGEFGFGSEIGISTTKLPPRGPVGLQQLVTYKYMVRGHGQTRP